MKEFFKAIANLFTKKGSYVNSGKPNNSSSPKPEIGEREFTFIWYKKTEIGNKNHYTEPFRTTVTAKDRKDALEKVTNFAMGKMKLVIYDEKHFDSSELGRIRKSFDDMNKMMDNFFK
jgi:hypothetical protein